MGSRANGTRYSQGTAGFEHNIPKPNFDKPTYNFGKLIYISKLCIKKVVKHTLGRLLEMGNHKALILKRAKEQRDTISLLQFMSFATICLQAPMRALHFT